MSRLKNLAQLSVNNNYLKSVPDEICLLSKLTELHMANNQLTVLPRSIGLLTNLSKLYLSRNQLYELPEELCKLRRLMILDVAGNKIQIFPSEIDELSLGELYCEENPLLQKHPIMAVEEEEVLSLLEITARFISKELKNRWSSLRVATMQHPEARKILAQGKKCALCGENFLNTWLECVRFKNVKKELKVTCQLKFLPVKVFLCSYKCFNQLGHEYYGVAVP